MKGGISPTSVIVKCIFHENVEISANKNCCGRFGPGYGGPKVQNKKHTTLFNSCFLNERVSFILILRAAQWSPHSKKFLSLIPKARPGSSPPTVLI